MERVSLSFAEEKKKAGREKRLTVAGLEASRAVSISTVDSAPAREADLIRMWWKPSDERVNFEKRLFGRDTTRQSSKG